MFRAMYTRFRREIRVYQLVLVDPRTPTPAKWLLRAAVAYALSPIDLIPDFIPLIGHLDDAVIIPALVWLVVRLIPRDVIQDCRAMADRSEQRPPADHPLLTLRPWLGRTRRYFPARPLGALQAPQETGVAMNRTTKSIVTTIAVATIVLLALTGCGKRTSRESRSSADSTPAPGTPGPQADSVIIALGNEPFWNVRVTANEILYRDPEHQEGYRFPPVAAVEEGDVRVYRTRRDIPAGDAGPPILELRIRQWSCSDGMSDRKYSMTALLKIGEETRTGCAYREVLIPMSHATGANTPR